ALQHLVYGLIELGNDGGRRLWRSSHCIPGARFEVLHSSFGERWYVRQTRDALVGCDSKDASLVGLVQFDRGRELHEDEIDVARDDVVESRRGSFVRNVHELGAGDALEQGRGQVRCGADALRGVVNLSGIRFDISDELLRRLGWKIGT